MDSYKELKLAYRQKHKRHDDRFIVYL